MPTLFTSPLIVLIFYLPMLETCGFFYQRHLTRLQLLLDLDVDLDMKDVILFYLCKILLKLKCFSSPMCTLTYKPVDLEVKMLWNITRCPLDRRESTWLMCWTEFTQFSLKLSSTQLTLILVPLVPSALERTNCTNLSKRLCSKLLIPTSIFSLPPDPRPHVERTCHNTATVTGWWHLVDVPRMFSSTNDLWTLDTVHTDITWRETYAAAHAYVRKGWWRHGTHWQDE